MINCILFSQQFAQNRVYLRFDLAKRLTEKQIGEIIKNFTMGENIDSLSKKFECTSPTIIRNLKKNLGALRYAELIKKNKISDENLNKINSDDNDDLNKAINIENEQNILKTKDFQLLTQEIVQNSLIFCPLKAIAKHDW